MYYDGNSLYEALLSNFTGRYFWPPKKTWLLAYGNGSGEPKAIVFVKSYLGKSADEIENGMTRKVAETGQNIARGNNIPFGVIEFENDLQSLTFNRERISLDSLRNRFKEVGLEVSGITNKNINSATSSPYHQWQRNNLGQIRVSDFDLFAANTAESEINRVIELKRSYIPLSDWEPYKADYPNFDLIARLCHKIDAKFLIAYNVRHKSPNFLDDPSRIKIFEYKSDSGSKSLGICELSNFIQGKFDHLSAT